MLKQVNGLLLKRKFNHKYFVKVRPFISVKARHMCDPVKQTVRDFHLDHIVLHCGTDDLSSERPA